MEIIKVIQKKEARDRVEACVGELERAVATFNSKFEQRVRAGLPICLDFKGQLLP